MTVVRQSTDFPGQPFGPGDTISVEITPTEEHSVRVDRPSIRQPHDLAGLARAAAIDIETGGEVGDTARVIAGLRRLIPLGHLAKPLADALEAAQQPERVL